MQVLDLVLHHDGCEWYVVADGIRVAHSDVTGLERDLLAHLSGCATREPFAIHLRCARDVLPAWMRQYGAHYFNRVLCCEPDRGDDV